MTRSENLSRRSVANRKKENAADRNASRVLSQISGLLRGHVRGGTAAFALAGVLPFAAGIAGLAATATGAGVLPLTAVFLHLLIAFLLGARLGRGGVRFGSEGASV